MRQIQIWSSNKLLINLLISSKFNNCQWFLNSIYHQHNILLKIKLDFQDSQWSQHSLSYSYFHNSHIFSFRHDSTQTVFNTEIYRNMNTKIVRLWIDYIMLPSRDFLSESCFNFILRFRRLLSFLLVWLFPKLDFTLRYRIFLNWFWD